MMAMMASSVKVSFEKPRSKSERNALDVVSLGTVPICFPALS
jgi:hypothetical protein